ncbi:uncharacterized protein LOC131230519 [Magnolia sinica]|uniref:uncharacterized protein LOC131230519 n=1 Tax=Magnolia sinica TaxID=86752 RepID=UPI002658B7FA|nr:uncharacterized protein LOC131230519 [Magnolia sinica]
MVSLQSIDFSNNALEGPLPSSKAFQKASAKAENTFGDISGKVVADFGCGCGTLGIAGALLGAEHVVGIDIDSQSLEIASLNAADLELDINLIWCNIKNLKWRGKHLIHCLVLLLNTEDRKRVHLEKKKNTICIEQNGQLNYPCRKKKRKRLEKKVLYPINPIYVGKIVDAVVMNPPFGTRKKGSDMDFLFTVLKVASQAVYSLHKTTTRDHVRRAALRDFNAKSAEVLCEGSFYCGAGADKALGRSCIWTISAPIILATGDLLYFEICLFRNVNVECIV